MNRIAVTKIERNSRTYTALISLDEKRNFQEFQIFEPDDEALLDRICIARVERVVPELSAAFVWISPEQKCYMPLEHMESALFTKRQSKNKPLCAGDELAVQVTKEAVKTKEPIVSAKLTLAGRYSLLTSGNTSLGVSKKLPDKLRQELSALLEELCTDHAEQGYGVLLRTNCAQVGREALREDVRSLVFQWRLLRQNAPRQSAYTRLVSGIPGLIRGMQSLSYDTVDKVYTDDETLYGEIADYLPYLKEQGKLELYQDRLVSLSTLYRIQGNLDILLGKRVWLPSGGNLIIEQTEAMTVIDVNSAKASAGRKHTALAVNREAAVEIPKQLRLRNISGIILVDFINVDSEKEEAEFVSILKDELRKDTVPSRFVDITKLGLVEITRKKVRKSLHEIL